MTKRFLQSNFEREGAHDEIVLLEHVPVLGERRVPSFATRKVPISSIFTMSLRV